MTNLLRNKANRNKIKNCCASMSYHGRSSESFDEIGYILVKELQEILLNENIQT